MIMAAVPGQKLVHCNKKYKNTGHQGMPQRHHQGHKRTPKQLALIIKRCLPMVLTGSGMLCTTANAEEYYFDPIMLSTELTPNSITSTLFMAINGVRSTSKISRKPTPISLSATIAIPTMAILVLMKPIPAIGTITVAKKVKFNSTSARQYLMG